MNRSGAILLTILLLSISCTQKKETLDKYRSIYHFTPASCWMNDPNGLIYKDGEYHLYFQANPQGDQWGNMTWGHAVSSDLVHWEQKDFVIYPDSLGAIFSGSCVLDQHNTAGFGEDAIVAIYTSASDDNQCESIAYSLDNGYSFTKYDGNPVLDKGLRDFRDPKVMRFGEKWIMTLAVGQCVEFYSSDNLKEWTFESSFGEGWGCHDGVWECPDLFQIGETWCLIVNVNPGAPSGGSGTQYFLGSFDGHKFHAKGTRTARWLDYGKDHYAAVTWSNVPDGRVICLAWMDNWQYAASIPTTGWRGFNSLPRELFVAKRDGLEFLASRPVREVESLRSAKKEYPSFRIMDNEDYNISSLIEDNTGAFEVVLRYADFHSDFAGFKLYNTEGDYVDFCINLIENKFSIDRYHSGLVDFSNDFPCRTETTIRPEDSYDFRIFVDVSSIECFCDGETVLTNLVFPSSPLNRINFYSRGGDCSVGELIIYNLAQ